MNRQQLIKAARRKSRELYRHLEHCEECREAVELLELVDSIGRTELVEAPSFLIKRAVEIAGTATAGRKIRRRIAEIVFDSWTLPQPVGVRGKRADDHRRLRFAVDDLQVDVRAERTKSGWEFVGQVTCKRADSTLFILKSGRKRISPGTNGLYQWSAKYPPKRLSLCSELEVINIPEIPWPRPQSK